MPEITLRDTALLELQFEVPSAAPPESYPTSQPLQLRVSTSSPNGDEQFACFIEGKIDEDDLPFKLSFTMGFLYDTAAEGLDADQLEPTFVWLAFPYIRELVADLTGRAPIEQYHLPTLSRPPKPEDLDRGDSSDRE